MSTLRYIPSRHSCPAFIEVPGPATLANVCRACGVTSVTPSNLLNTGALDGMPFQIEDAEHGRYADGGVDSFGKLTIFLCRTDNHTDAKTFQTIDEAVCYSTDKASVEPADMILLPLQDRVSLGTMCKNIQKILDRRWW